MTQRPREWADKRESYSDYKCSAMDSAQGMSFQVERPAMKPYGEEHAVISYTTNRETKSEGMQYVHWSCDALNCFRKAIQHHVDYLPRRTSKKS